MPPKKKKPEHEHHYEQAPDNVIYVEADEEVMSVIDRVKKSDSNELFIVVPSRALLLQSVVNLKLIKKEAAAAQKEVSIVTTDRKGMNLASQVGLTVYQDLKGRVKKEMPPMQSHASHHKPVESLEEEVEEELMENPTENAPKRSMKSYLSSRVTSMKGKLKKNSKSPNGKQVMDVGAFVSASPNRRILSLFIGISLFLLIVIAYFVLPQATVHIDPKEVVEKPLERIVLADSGLNAALLKINDDNIIASFPIETEIELTKKYSSTGITSTGSDAHGQVIIFNDSSSTQPLVKTTRLQTPEGLIFRIQKDVIIPPHQSAAVDVLADKLDLSGQVIGQRGNIAPTRLTFPGLKGSNQDLVYAKNTDPFTGGKTETTAVVKQQDIDASKDNIVGDLKSVAKDKLKARLVNENKTRDAQLELLNSDQALQVNVEDVHLIGDIKDGTITPDFQVYGKIKVIGVTYDRNEAIKILDRKLTTVIHPDQIVASVDYPSLKLEFVAFDQNGKTKVNASMNYRLQYELNDDLKTQIKQHIVGKGIQEAKDYIQGLTEVGNITITTWPFWVQSIPGVAWNVIIDVSSDIK